MNTPLLGLAVNIASHTFAIVCIFEGVRRICAIGPSKGAVLSLAFGLLYCVGYAGFSFRANKFQHEASTLLQKEVAVPELPKNWGGNILPKQKSEFSLGLARAAFSESGKLRFYFDESGRRLLYAPSQVDLDQREKKIAQLAQLQYAMEESSNTPASWLLVALAAALFGFGWARGQPANPPFGKGRRKSALPIN